MTRCYLLLVYFTISATALADPCGMVPPITPGGGSAPLVRTGDQRTYVFHRNGVETFVIRPGFNGKVDEFGMLIPFPEAPAIRKVPDAIFPHIAAAIDPPEVLVDLIPRPVLAMATNSAAPMKRPGMKFNGGLTVLSEEAVGMYEVAVLAAGSPEALKRWMTDHSYRYPEGMDDVCADYIKLGWCFVAIKTKVSAKGAVEPSPGQREVKPSLPSGGFDGFVQAMGFRFRSEKLVVPMRLSAFNDGEMRNIVYVLAEDATKVKRIPEEYVVRQLPGEAVMANVTQPLPLRIIGGTEKDIPEYRRKLLVAQRDPAPKNGAAKELFASDLLAADSGNLSLPHEEQEKELLRIGERLMLRGGDIDKVNEAALAGEREKIVAKSLDQIEKMTLTVIDGDFPREVVAGANLTFASYKMPPARNDAKAYDAKIKGPAPKQRGVLHLGALPPQETPTVAAVTPTRRSYSSLLLVIGAIFAIGVFACCRRFVESSPRKAA